MPEPSGTRARGLGEIRRCKQHFIPNRVVFEALATRRATQPSRSNHYTESFIFVVLLSSQNIFSGESQRTFKNFSQLAPLAGWLTARHTISRLFANLITSKRKASKREFKSKFAFNFLCNSDFLITSTLFALHSRSVNWLLTSLSVRGVRINNFNCVLRRSK